MAEIDLMKNYPKINRSELIELRRKVNSKNRLIAQKFDKEYFDGPREFGLGGYKYDKKFFGPVVQDIANFYQLKGNVSILDVGCAKGFMMKDFKELLPKSIVQGIDISKYCLDTALEEMKPFITLGSCDNLPFPEQSFDLVVSIATIHNLDLEGVKKSLKEIIRVSKKYSYIKVNGYKNEIQKRNLNSWNLVAKTILHVNEWRQVFREVGYDGDYSFFST